MTFVSESPRASTKHPHELIWILDNDRASVTLYKQTLGLQYSLRILKSMEELIEGLREKRSERDSWLLIADPENSRNALGELFKHGTLPGSPTRLPECMIISRVDDLSLMRFYLKAGARDYLLKPVRPNELVAKVERALHQINNREILILRNDLDGKEVSDLTLREHQMLTLFLSRTDRSVKRDELYGAIWSKVNVSPKTLDVHVFNLRRKLRPLGYDIICQNQTFSLCKRIAEA